MTLPLQPHPSTARPAALAVVLTLPLWFASCSSTDVEGVPSNLPEIALSGSMATPPHHMATYEYPFDSAGNYVSEWAAEGERRAGRSPRATSEDERKWGSSHGGRASPGSGKRKKGSAAKPKSSSTRYIVKKGDTLERIARRFGISVSRLKAANGLKSGTLRAGKTLIIPS